LVLGLARTLGSAGFGVFSIAWTTGWLLALASDLGLHLMVTREAARRAGADPGLVGSALAAKAVLAAVAAALVLLLAPVLVPPADRGLLWTVSGGLLALSFEDFVQHLLRGRGRFGRDAALSVTARLATLAAGLGGVTLGGLAGAGLGILAGGLVAAGAAALVMTREVGRPRLDREPAAAVGRLLGESLPIGAGIVFSLVAFRVDVYLLSALAGDRAVGWYAAAYRLFEASQLVPAVLLMVVFPRLAASAGQPDGEAGLRRGALATLTAAGLGLATVVAVGAPWLVAALYGPEFASAAGPLGLLVWAAPVMFVNYLVTHDLIARGRQTRYAGAAAAALAANVVLNLLAIPRYGMYGAAGVTIATELVLLAGCVLGLRAAGGRAAGIARWRAHRARSS
jgi:O-antigen/teichoic acid export membrane protein